jgi:alpha-glucosidase
MESEWWRGAIIYQIYPRSFFDTNEDGTGDLPGIKQKLDYISSLGVDAIWISPFFKSPMRDFGYDVADYRAVDPIFGTNSDFVALLTLAHERGLKVIIETRWYPSKQLGVGLRRLGLAMGVAPQAVLPSPLSTQPTEFELA